MKRFNLIAVFLLAAATARADTGFVHSLTPEDFSAAGLQKLTPEELARLEAAVQRYKSGEVAEVQKQAEVKATATQQEAERRVAAAETKAKEAEVKATATQQEAEKQVAAAETKAKEAAAKADEAVAKAKQAETKAVEPAGKKPPGWFTALLTLHRAGEKPEKEQPLEGRLVGDFTGWHGHTVFTLEDGTRWAQQNKTDSYEYFPVLHSPKVKIRPAAINGFWMEIEGVNLNVRVVPLELKERK